MGLFANLGFVGKKKKSLKETGIRIGGEVKDVVLNQSVVVNGRAQRRILAVATTPDGVPRYFESGNVSYNVGPEIIGYPVNVYVDPDDYDKFYVDVDQWKTGGSHPVATIRF